MNFDLFLEVSRLLNINIKYNDLFGKSIFIDVLTITIVRWLGPPRRDRGGYYRVTFPWGTTRLVP